MPDEPDVSIRSDEWWNNPTMDRIVDYADPIPTVSDDGTIE